MIVLKYSLLKPQNWLWFMKLITHLHLVPSLRMFGVLPPYLQGMVLNDRDIFTITKGYGTQIYELGSTGLA
jgi:hypothetical protein